MFFNLEVELIWFYNFSSPLTLWSDVLLSITSRSQYTIQLIYKIRLFYYSKHLASESRYQSLAVSG